jgi:hypothetical protein
MDLGCVWLGWQAPGTTNDVMVGVFPEHIHRKHSTFSNFQVAIEIPHKLDRVSPQWLRLATPGDMDLQVPGVPVAFERRREVSLAGVARQTSTDKLRRFPGS